MTANAADLNSSPFAGKLEFNDLTVEDAIRRAKWALSTGYKGQRPGQPDDETIDLEKRQFYLNAADTHLHLAEVLQAERDYEERKYKEIVDGGTGV